MSERHCHRFEPFQILLEKPFPIGEIVVTFLFFGGKQSVGFIRQCLLKITAFLLLG
ncbi:MAG: hypothetical protein M2R45_02917 [Verrucomicrobia subdivision 3 bacterium]|nr:hypothetical protein [Limisphaerales bacterium]MCS1415361.1 hypothetical protein [Limisphaerales bacterium]